MGNHNTIVGAKAHEANCEIIGDVLVELPSLSE